MVVLDAVGSSAHVEKRGISMRRQKRDMKDRAYHKGYHAGISGRAKSQCPHASGDTRQHGLCGGREGRNDSWASLKGVSGLSNIVQHEIA